MGGKSQGSGPGPGHQSAATAGTVYSSITQSDLTRLADANGGGGEEREDGMACKVAVSRLSKIPSLVHKSSKQNQCVFVGSA